MCPAAAGWAGRRYLGASVAAGAWAEGRAARGGPSPVPCVGEAVAMGPGRLSQSLLLRCRRAAAALGMARCRPSSARPLSATVGLRAPQRPPGRGEPPRAGGGGRWKGVTDAGGGAEEEEEEEDEEDVEEEEVEELLGPSPLAVGPGAQRLAVVHPAVKWGPKKSPLTTGAWGWWGGRMGGGAPPAGVGRVSPPRGSPDSPAAAPCPPPSSGFRPS